MKTAIILISGLIVLTVLIFLFSKAKNKNEPLAIVPAEKAVSIITGQMVVDTLNVLGYFKYTDAQNIDTLKKEIAIIYNKYKVLTTVSYTIPPFEPFCRRLYTCDGETLFEFGGIIDYLKDIKPTFDKLNIPLQWNDDFYSEDATEHSIIINDKKYFAFKGNPNDPRAWGIATKNFVEIINDQLQMNHSDERVYPILFNNDGRIIFLTRPQYDYIYANFDKKESPMEINLWWDTFK